MTWKPLPALALVAAVGVATFFAVRPHGGEPVPTGPPTGSIGSGSPASAIARPREGPPPIPTASHSVTYPKPPERPAITFPPWQFPEREPQPPPPPSNPPATIADLRDAAEGRSRCAEGVRTRLYLLEGDRLVGTWEEDEALALEGSLDQAEGRREGERALPLVALLRGREGVTAVEVWPCRGDPVSFPVESLRAAPTRYVLLMSRNRGYKLADMDARGRPVLKGVAAVRLVP
jgi:hypothetical protein